MSVSKLQSLLDKNEIKFSPETLLDDQVPPEICCPITQLIMIDPVKTDDNNTYERRAIERWFNHGHSTSPLTNLNLPTLNLIPNIELKNIITQYLRQKQRD